MKPLFFITLLFAICCSCDIEDARTPLGITISAADVQANILENPEEGALIATLTATASDDSPINYTLESETAEGALSVDLQTGAVSVADASLFDYAVNTEINASINATARSLSEEILLTIFIEEVRNIGTDRETLLSIYEENTENILDWDIESEDITQWTGVTVTDERVTALDISNDSISSIPVSINRLSAITSLNLSENQIVLVPETLSELNLSFLNITGNNINGVLPQIICETFDFEEDANFSKDDTAICNDEDDQTDTETTEDNN